MREKTCCFTGHRDISPLDYGRVKDALYKAVKNLIEEGVVYFGCGGALGFDTMAAKTVLDLKKEYPHIKLIMVYPCKNQTEFWQKRDIEIYDHIRAACDKHVYVSETYTKACMFKRNRHLVDHSRYCICYLTRAGGGTRYTVNYALEQGLQVINLAEI